MSLSSGPQWELSKENAAPLERGRSVKTLACALSPESRESNAHEARRYERLVRPSEKAAKVASDLVASGEESVDADAILDKIVQRDLDDDKGSDPLVHWLSYIKFHQEAFPSDTKKQFLLMERCTRAMVSFPRYRDDGRLIRVCILYADKTSAPSDIFKYLHQQRVGTKTALFWIAWAWVAEKAGDFPFAEKVFLKGLKKKAQPAKLLEQRHRQFRRRMSRHWLDNASKDKKEEGDLGDDDLEADVDQENRRGALSGLTADGARRNYRGRGANSIPSAFTSGQSRVDNIGNVGGVNGTTSLSRGTSSSRMHPSSQMSTFGSRRGAGGSHHPSAGNSTGAKGGFSIFFDGESGDENNQGYNLDQSVSCSEGRSAGVGARHRRIETESDRRKENRGKTERWNERGGLESSMPHSYPEEARHPRPQAAGHRHGASGSFSSRMAGRDDPASAPVPTFEVFVDEECAQKHHKEEEAERMEKDQRSRELGGGRSLRERVDGGVADRLARDPLRYVRNPSKVESDRFKYGEDCGLIKKKDLCRDDDARPSTDAGSKKVNKKVVSGFTKRLLAKDQDGQERCFEEARAAAKYYRLVSSEKDINLLEVQEIPITARESSTMELEEDESSINDVEMEDDITEVEDNRTEYEGYSPHDDTQIKSIRQSLVVQGTREESTAREPTPQRVLFGLNRSVASALNTSVASSTMDEMDAVGVPMGKEEETINTKFAKIELSMMFSSPQMGVRFNDEVSSNQLPVPNYEGEKDENGDTASFSLVAALMEDDKNLGTSASILAGVKHPRDGDGEESDENECPRNLMARTNQGSSDVKVVAAEQRVLGELTTVKILGELPTTAQGDPSLRGNTDFRIFCDGEDIQVKDESAKQMDMGPAPFSVYEDGEYADNPKANEVTNSAAAFSIFADSEDADNAKENQEVTNSAAPFSIFNDGVADEPIANQEVTNSAAPFSIFVDGETVNEPIADQEVENNASPFSIFVDNESLERPVEGKKTMNTVPFTIFEGSQDDCDNTESNEGKDNSDTATLSVIGDTLNDAVDSPASTEAFTIFDDAECHQAETKQHKSLRHRARRHLQCSTSVKANHDSKANNFPIFCDDDGGGREENENRKKKIMVDHNVITENARYFGDISHIAPDNAEGMESPYRRVSQAHTQEQMSPILSYDNQEELIEYDKLHNEDMETALREIMLEAAESYEIPIFDHQGISIPRALLQRLPTNGREIEIGNTTADVKYELGRGAYGVVFLCEMKGSQAFTSALKVQSPTDCLAWEFTVLKKIQDRLKLSGHTECAGGRRPRMKGRDGDDNVLPPFPLPLSFVAFSNGGLLSMTAGSTSGLTLVDVVNAHRVSGGGPVPELIAIHYTARMLQHIENLHWYGKILHCDVKADNWVLVAPHSGHTKTDDTSAPGSELMLVDFGRAVDLATVNCGKPDKLEARILGKAAKEDMACAAIREGLPWGADIDTYGICASAFVLLYGIHMDIEKDPASKRWRPHKPLRRYWNKSLWNKLFDTLLNLDGKERNLATGSHPNSLRALRKSFEEYLASGGRKKDLQAELNRQSSILPKRRG